MHPGLLTEPGWNGSLPSSYRSGGGGRLLTSPFREQIEFQPFAGSSVNSSL